MTDNAEEVDLCNLRNVSYDSMKWIQLSQDETSMVTMMNFRLP